MTKPWGRWKKKTHKAWLKRIWRRVYAHNQNYIFFIWGPAGSGKSEDGLSIGEMLCPRFNIKHVVFGVQDFFNAITSPDTKQGDFILFEEVGAEISNRDYYTQKNIVMGKTMQTIRTKNLIVGYTAPKLEMADKQILGMCMGLVSTTGIDYTTSEGLVRIYDPVTYDMKSNKWNKRLLQVKRPSQINPKRFWTLKIGTTRIARASLKLRHEYLKARKAYTDRLIGEGQVILTRTAAEEKAGPAQRSVSPTQIGEWSDEVVNHKADFMDDNRFNLPAVQNKFGCSLAVAKRIKEQSRGKLEKIGYVVLWR
jgi:hypothetical protein